MTPSPRKPIALVLQTAGRRLMHWRVAAAKGDRKALVQGFLSALALVAIVALWLTHLQPLPVTSVLHPLAPVQAPLNVRNGAHSSVVTTDGDISTTVGTFPQYGASSLPGRLFQLENTRQLSQPGNKGKDSLLVMVVTKDAMSWGEERTAADFFKLLDTFDYPKEKMSVTLLTSSMSEFDIVKTHFQQQIGRYSRLSVLFRNDFSPQEVVTRENRHVNQVQADRRRVIARYRNFAVLSTLEWWHEHVVWLDADVHKVSPGLLKKMTQSGRDIVEPMCVRMKVSGQDWYEYDLNAWVGRRKVRRSTQDSEFVPGDLSVSRMKQFHGGDDAFVPLDSVGGTMLYVNADVHRQGIVFPVHHVIGSEWEREGYDGIETEGLCYIAHFLGFKCWGMPNDLIYHI
ncbi:hypothetical protein PRIC2_001721 [Phytophthora ramorum]